MLGFYESFPVNIHGMEAFATPLSSKKLQRRLIQVLQDVNSRTFSFEEVACPTMSKCTIIFETGLAEAKSFNYIDEEETEKVLSALREASFQIMDFFCAIRYYKETAKNKTALKFDYYLVRFIFGKNAVEIQVFHERGPRYISPEDIITFLVNEVNKTSSRRTFKRVEAES